MSRAVLCFAEGCQAARIIAPLVTASVLVTTVGPAAAGPGLADLLSPRLASVVAIAGTRPDLAPLEAPPPGACPDWPDLELPAKDGDPSRDPVGHAAPAPGAAETLGSGFVIAHDTTRLLIATSEHVIDGAHDLAVTFPDGRRVAARPVGADPLADLAVLAVTVGETAPAPLAWGDSGRLRPGDPVIAVGAPYGFAGSVTVGVVSGRARVTPDNEVMALLQHDADLNPGSSGGPLFDESGAVIGVNTAIHSPDDSSIGLGFAIPSAAAQPVIAALVAGRPVARGWIGVTAQALTPALAAALDTPADQGAVVTGIDPDGPALGRLALGDVVVAIEGGPVEGPRDLARAAYHARPGDRLALELRRAGRPRQVALAVAAPRATDAGGGTESDEGARPLAAVARLGLTLVAGPGAVRVAAVGAGSVAETAGLRAGDRLVALGAEPVADPETLSAGLDRLAEQGGAEAALLVARGAERHYLLLSLDALATVGWGGLDRAGSGCARDPGSGFKVPGWP